MTLRVAIIGAGIGGLTAAASLRANGAVVDVYEQAAALTEIGAGLSLFANGQRVLNELGVLDGLATVAAEPQRVVIRHGDSGAEIVKYPLGQDGWYRHQTGYPYLGVHRAELLERLAAAAGADQIHLEHRLVGLEPSPNGDGVTLLWDGGAVSHADMVIGADGARSAVRRWMFDTEKAIYTGNSGFRGIIESRRVPSLENPGDLQFWIGPRGHLLHFPISPGGDRITFLAAVEDPQEWPDKDNWRVPTTRVEAISAFADFHPTVREIVGAIDHSERWGLFRMEPLPTWHRARVTLLGDAAHAMLPHHGQGANVSMEDAYILAQVLTRSRDTSIEARLLRYEGIRKRRTEKVQLASWRANHLLHFPEHEDTAERDKAFTSIPYDIRWIHDYDASAISIGNEPVTAETEH